MPARLSDAYQTISLADFIEKGSYNFGISHRQSIAFAASFSRSNDGGEDRHRWGFRQS